MKRRDGIEGWTWEVYLILFKFGEVLDFIANLWVSSYTLSIVLLNCDDVKVNHNII